MNLLEVENVSKTYGQGETSVHALKNVAFSVSKGELIGAGEAYGETWGFVTPDCV